MTPRTTRQGGFTLIELMVGMVLGLFILIALLALLANVSRGNSELAKTNRMIENGRLSIQLLQNDISHAGFWDGYLPDFDDLTASAVPTTVPAGVPDPCADWSTATAAYKAEVLGVPVVAYQATGSFSRTSTVTAPVCATALGHAVPATDVLVVRHAEPCVQGTGSDECAAVSNGNVYFQASKCSTETATPYILEAATAGTGTYTLHKRDCTTVADIRRLASTIYHVKLVNGVPTLMMSRLANGSHPASQALIENVEAFVVEFGLDDKSDTGANVDFTAAVNWTGTGYTSPANRGDGNADSYVRCTSATPCTAAQLMNAVSVKLYVLVRAEEPTGGVTDNNTYELGTSTNKLSIGPASDGYRRQLFTQTIRLANVSGRRETP